MNKETYKAGYDGPDLMRKRAEEMLQGEFEKTPMEAPKGLLSPENRKPRLFKKGGALASMCAKRAMRHKFAAGGVAKIRHGEATAAGLPILKKNRKGR